MVNGQSNNSIGFVSMETDKISERKYCEEIKSQKLLESQCITNHTIRIERAQEKTGT